MVEDTGVTLWVLMPITFITVLVLLYLLGKEYW